MMHPFIGCVINFISFFVLRLNSYKAKSAFLLNSLKLFPSFGEIAMPNVLLINLKLSKSYKIRICWRCDNRFCDNN